MLKGMRIGQKFVLMGAIFLVALLLVTYRMVSSMRALGTVFAQKELSGLEYQRPLIALIRQLQTHRGLAVSLLEGDASFDAQEKTTAQHVAEALAAVDQADAQDGAALQVSDTWTDLRGRVRVVMDHWRDAGRTVFDQHTELIAACMALVARIGDTSNLSFDPYQDSYYLADATRIAIPELAEVMGQVRDLAIGIAAQGGMIREEELKAFSRRYAIVYYYTDRLKTDYTKVYAFDDSVQPRLEARRQALSTAATEFLEALDQDFINVQYAKISPSAWWDVATRAVDATYALYDVSTPALQDILDARVSRLSRQLDLTILLLAVGGLIVAGIAVLIIRDINRPLRDAVRAAEQLAAGDLSVSFSAAGRGDEIGALAEAFGGMVRALRTMAEAADRISRGNLAVDVQPQSPQDVMGSALARMATNLRQQIGSILDGTSHLSSATTSISAALTQVVTGATRAATAVDAAAATVGEVKQTVQMASARAGDVRHNAQAAVQISDSGGKAVQDAVDGMTRVRDQMKMIAKRVAQLGEQSRAIARIIATVNDLADQSDLLSVNAGVEAVRAGAAGKGFAVVAQEMKNLADRSKRATAQIGGILSDIQKAATDAVTATEQGTKTAEAGMQQSVDAGEAIRRLADSLAAAAQSVADIAAATREQLVDIDQITAAMDNIRSASNQNVASVRQIEASVHELTDVNATMQDLVGHYTLE